MFSPFERMVAGRYLRARKQEGFVSVIAGFSFLGIMLGVATLIIVMSVMNGFRTELITRILGLNGHLNVYSTSGPLTNYDNMADLVHGVDGVVDVFPTIEGQALMTVRGVSSGVIVRGLRADDLSRRPVLSTSIIEGNLDFYRQDMIAIGTRMSERLGLHPGDRVRMMSSVRKSTPFGEMPVERTFTIGLVFDVGMYEYDNNFIYMPLSLAQKFYQYKDDAVSNLEVLVDNPSIARDLKDEIAFKVEGRAGVYDWMDSNSSFFNALQVERNVMFLILTLIVLVAAFNIISSLIMLVKDKGSDIAILRTMGASRGMIMRIFFLTGASIGVAGTAAGAALGIAFASNIEAIRQWIEGFSGAELFAGEIYFLSKLPAQIEWNEVTLVIVMALILSFAASVYPARRAAWLDPVEALRYG